MDGSRSAPAAGYAEAIAGAVANAISNVNRDHFPPVSGRSSTLPSGRSSTLPSAQPAHFPPFSGRSPLLPSSQPAESQPTTATAFNYASEMRK